MKLRTVLIDDEKNGLTLLKEYLRSFESEIEIVGTASSSYEAFKVIRKEKPNLVFLDISMPGGNGVDLLDKFEKIDFHVVFITAHAGFAVEAFRRNAVHYLLKPFELQDLDAAINRVLEREARARNRTGDSENSTLRRKINIPTQQGYQMLEVNKIIRCEADRAYTSVFLDDGNVLTVSQNLKVFENILSKYHFIRVHRSHLISLDRVTNFSKGTGSEITMEDGAKIYLTKEKKEEFLRLIEDYTLGNLN